MDQLRPYAFPPKKILVPLDLTEASVVAWKQAKDLAVGFGASVDGLFVQEWVYQGDLPAAPADPDAALNELKAKLAAGDEIRAVKGAIEETILSWGRNLDYDLIVMGSHARKGLQRLLRGSVAEAVVNSASVPVLVVRKPIGRARTVLAPVNFEPYALAGLQAAGDVALALGARLTVLHVLNSPVYGGPSTLKGPKHLLSDAVNKLSNEVRTLCRPTTALSFGDPAQQIAEAAESADLVVLVAHRKGFLNDLVLGTTTERLLRHSSAAILTMPAAQPARARRKTAARASGRM
jgi:nucleotide-binding universal stress UspA family protein